MRSTVQDDGVGGRRRSGASLSPVGWRRRRARPGAGRSRTSRRLPPGSIHGTVQDEQRRAGRRRDGFGARRHDRVRGHRSRAAVSSCGRCRPGPYLRARASRRVRRVARPDRRRASERARVLRPSRCGTSPTPQHAGVISGAGGGLGAAGGAAPAAADRRRPRRTRRTTTGDDDHSEIAWRLRHARRASSRTRRFPRRFCGAERRPTTAASAGPNVFGRAVGSPARLATNFFADTPFSGQVNLLTTGSFDTPQQLFSTTTSRATSPISRSARRSASTRTGRCAPR